MQLSEANQLPGDQLKEELRKCCGSSAWVEQMAVSFPFADKDSLLKKANEVWYSLNETDWLEAFRHHPKIGDINSFKQKFASTATWAAGEQSSVQQASEQTLQKLATGNRQYEEKFGFIFIVCATGKSAAEMLQLLQSRLPNNRGAEIKIAATEQAKITSIRLEKWLT